MVCRLPETERPAVLDQMCGGDEALRVEVEALLAHDSADGLLADAALGIGVAHLNRAVRDPDNATPKPVAPGGAATPPCDTHPAQIGRYRIRRLIGMGGMGAVYEAEQENPRRTVALKLLRPGVASAQMLKRFAPEPGRDGHEIKVVDVLQRAADGIAERFREQPEIEAALRNTLGHTYRALGILDAAKDQFVRALKIQTRVPGEGHEDTLDTMLELGGILDDTDHRDDAERLLHRALALCRDALGEKHHLTGRAMAELGETLQATGRHDEAQSLLRKAVAVLRAAPGEHGGHESAVSAALHALATSLQAQGKIAEAVPIFRDLLATLRREPKPDPTGLSAVAGNLAAVLVNQKKNAEAAEILTAAIRDAETALPSGHWTLGILEFSLATAQEGIEDYRSAENHYRRSYEILRGAFDADNYTLARAARGLSWMCVVQDRAPEAESLQRERLDVRRRHLGPQDPRTYEEWLWFAIRLSDRGETSRAEEYFRALLTMARQAWPEGHVAMAQYESDYSLCLTRMGRYADAEPLLRRAQQTLSAAGPEKAELARAALVRLADLYDAWGKPTEAEAARSRPAE